MTDYDHTGNEDDLQAIARVREAHVAALCTGDAAAWAAQFTDDGVQLPPNTAANFGRAEIEAWGGGFMDLFELDFALGVEEVHAFDEWAFERGTYTIGLKPKAGGPTMQDAGKYITVYQRKPGTGWRMARDIWNSSVPPPGP